jgi:hypothetical protein
VGKKVHLRESKGEAYYWEGISKLAERGVLELHGLGVPKKNLSVRFHSSQCNLKPQVMPET